MSRELAITRRRLRCATWRARLFQVFEGLEGGDQRAHHMPQGVTHRLDLALQALDALLQRRNVAPMLIPFMRHSGGGQQDHGENKTQHLHWATLAVTADP
jgi:hypothetical protein